MKLTPKTCPWCRGKHIKNAYPKGLVDRVIAVALISRQDDGSFEYCGGSEVDWDSQQSICDEPGMVLAICHAGHEWKARIED